MNRFGPKVGQIGQPDPLGPNLVTVLRGVQERMSELDQEIGSDWPQIHVYRSRTNLGLFRREGEGLVESTDMY